MIMGRESSCGNSGLVSEELCLRVCSGVIKIDGASERARVGRRHIEFGRGGNEPDLNHFDLVLIKHCRHAGERWCGRDSEAKSPRCWDSRGGGKEPIGNGTRLYSDSGLVTQVFVQVRILSNWVEREVHGIKGQLLKTSRGPLCASLTLAGATGGGG